MTSLSRPHCLPVPSLPSRPQVSGKTVGVVGTGKIGVEFCCLLKARCTLCGGCALLGRATRLHLAAHAPASLHRPAAGTIALLR